MTEVSRIFSHGFSLILNINKRKKLFSYSNIIYFVAPKLTSAQNSLKLTK